MLLKVGTVGKQHAFLMAHSTDAPITCPKPCDEGVGVVA
jgi:hypothetical protein